MVLNQFDVKTTRRLALGLLAASGALLLKSLDLVVIAATSGQAAYAARLGDAPIPLAASVAFAVVAFACAEIADHPSTPETGHPHSKPNYLQTAFALTAVPGLGFFAIGGYVLLSAVRDIPG